LEPRRRPCIVQFQGRVSGLTNQAWRPEDLSLKVGLLTEKLARSFAGLFGAASSAALATLGIGVFPPEKAPAG